MIRNASSILATESSSKKAETSNVNYTTVLQNMLNKPRINDDKSSESQNQISHGLMQQIYLSNIM